MQSTVAHRASEEMPLIQIPKDAGSSHPISCLPDNVLRDMFCWTVAMAENDPPAQYYLSGVCRHWRDLALHCPLLWTDICIPMRDPAYDPLVFFERSAPALFNVTFYSSWTQDTDIHDQVSRAILNNLSRLRRLTIDVINFDEIAPLFEAWRDRQTPNFTHLEIACHDNFEPEKDLTATFLSRGDSLRNVKLGGLRSRFLPVLHQLTVLEIDRLRPGPRTLRDLFVQCPGLETFTVGVLSAPTEIANSTLPWEEISAPSLKKLAINLDNDHTESCSCALPHLIADNLQYLEISHYGTIFADHYVSLASHLNEFPHLHTLRIRSHLFMEEDMDFLASLPDGTNLEIIGFPSHRDPGAGLPIVSLENLGSITIDLTPTMSKYSSDFDIVAFHGLLQNTRDLTFNCPVAVCCDCDENSLNSWKIILDNRFSIRSTPLQTGFLDNYLNSYDEFLDRLSGSSQDEYYDWDGDDYEYQDYEDYDDDDGADYDPDAPCVGSEEEVEL